MKVLKVRYSIRREPTEADELVDVTSGGFHFHFREYVTDEKGRRGVKFLAEGSSGYDFHYADEEFILFPGDVYQGSWSYEEGDGPSDWDEVFVPYAVQLVEVDE